MFTKYIYQINIYPHTHIHIYICFGGRINIKFCFSFCTVMMFLNVLQEKVTFLITEKSICVISFKNQKAGYEKVYKFKNEHP